MMKKLQSCIKTKRVNNSHSREIIYKILFENKKCLSVSEIINFISTQHHSKISLNTIYRHLRFLIDCELIFTIQNDLKKAYYCFCRDEIDVFEVCPKCNNIKKVDITICDAMKLSDFITLHKKCIDCL